MKKFKLLLLLLASVLVANAQTKTATKKVEKKEVEIACGECMFQMAGKGCNLAVKIDGTPYFVDGRKLMILEMRMRTTVFVMLLERQ